MAYDINEAAGDATAQIARLREQVETLMKDRVTPALADAAGRAEFGFSHRGGFRARAGRDRLGQGARAAAVGGPDRGRHRLRARPRDALIHAGPPPGAHRGGGGGSSPAPQRTTHRGARDPGAGGTGLPVRRAGLRPDRGVVLAADVLGQAGGGAHPGGRGTGAGGHVRPAGGAILARAHRGRGAGGAQARAGERHQQPRLLRAG